MSNLENPNEMKAMTELLRAKLEAPENCNFVRVPDKQEFVAYGTLEKAAPRNLAITPLAPPVDTVTTHQAHLEFCDTPFGVHKAIYVATTNTLYYRPVSVSEEARFYKANRVTLSHDEATRILHLMRNVQMNLGAAQSATHPVEREANLLFSNEFAGELNELINSLEGSLFEVGLLIHTADRRNPEENDE